MRRFRGLTIVLPAALCLTACPSDENAVDGGGSGSDSSGTAGSTGGSSVTNATMPATTNSSNDGSSSGTPPGTTSGNPTTGNPTTGGSTGGDPCLDCIDTNCGDQFAACQMDEDRLCWLACINDGTDPMECAGNCNGPNDTFNEFAACAGAECAEACAGGGGSTGGSTGGGSTGGMTGGMYDECMGPMNDCPMGLVCNDFLQTCTIDCNNDGDCSPAATGDATPACSGFSDTCVLDCSNGETCPDGMSCNGFDVCEWP